MCTASALSTPFAQPQDWSRRSLYIVYYCIQLGKGELEWMIEFLEEDKLLTWPYPLTSSPTFILHTASTAPSPSPEPISEGTPKGKEGILTIWFQWPYTPTRFFLCSTVLYKLRCTIIAIWPCHFSPSPSAASIIDLMILMFLTLRLRKRH